MVPDKYQSKLIEAVHETYGHIGAKKTRSLIGSDFYVKNLRHKVAYIVSTCDMCQRSKTATRPSKAPMQNILPEKPGEFLSIDFYGPLPTSTGGVKHIFVTIDVFSKLVCLYPIKRATTAIILKKIFSNYCEKYGKPEKIICDHGTQFTAKKWQDKLEEEKIQLLYSSIRYPQGNIVGRVNRELGKFFRIFVKDNHTAWACYVPLIQEIINETCHESTEMTPHELHFNQRPTRPWTRWIQSHYR